jgi:hypothetical protein
MQQWNFAKLARTRLDLAQATNEARSGGKPFSGLAAECGTGWLGINRRIC